MRCDDGAISRIQEQLHPEDFHFRAGVRQNLDIQFLRVMATRPPEVIKSDFIKQAVVDWFESKQQRQEEISEAEKVKRELEAKIRRLEGMIRSGVGAGVVIESAAASEEEKRKVEVDEVKAKEAEAKVKALTDVF